MPAPPSAEAMLVAMAEIRQLAYKYAFAVDSRDRDLMLSLWAEPAGPVDYPDINLLTARADHPRWFGKGPTVHFVGNHIIDVTDEDHATGKVYCWAQLDLIESFVDQSLLYLDDYVRVDGRWLFWQRRHLLWFGQRRSENPIDQQPDGWPMVHYGRGSLPGDVLATEEARGHLVR